MPENLYTKFRHAKHRGPTTSDDNNARIEENYKDLTYILNRLGITDEDQMRFVRRLVNDVFSLAKVSEALLDRVASLEDDTTRILFHDAGSLDNDRFDETQYAIPEVTRLSHDNVHGLLTLPKVTTGSISKLKFVNSDGTAIVPSTFETLVDGVETTADNTGAYIDTSDPYFAVINKTGKVWERNVIVNAADPDGAQAYLYVRLPTDLSVIGDSNAIQLHPYPMMGSDILEIAYSIEPDVVLNDTDNYTPLNEHAIHSGDTNAVGWIAPGGWTNDEMINAGPKTFYFDPLPITAIRIKIGQPHYFLEADKIIYSYGLSKLDIRYDKFLDSGKTIIRFDAPDGDTISDIEDIFPEVWNTSEGQLADVFTYKFIWETSFDSGVYTETYPGSPAQRVWVEVTLNKTIGNGTPALSGLIVEYS